MRKNFIFTMMTLAFAGSVFISCSSDNNDSPKTATVQSDTIKNIYAEKVTSSSTLHKRIPSRQAQMIGTLPSIQQQLL